MSYPDIAAGRVEHRFWTDQPTLTLQECSDSNDEVIDLADRSREARKSAVNDDLGPGFAPPVAMPWRALCQECLGAPTGLAAGTVDEDPVHGVRFSYGTRVGVVEGHRSSAPWTVLARRGRRTAQRGVLGNREPVRPLERHSPRVAHGRRPSTAFSPGQMATRPQSALPKRLPWWSNNHAANTSSIVALTAKSAFSLATRWRLARGVIRASGAPRIMGRARGFSLGILATRQVPSLRVRRLVRLHRRTLVARRSRIGAPAARRTSQQ